MQKLHNNDILWDLAGRPKLRKINEAYERMKEGKPLGRAIWIPDMEESILGQCFTKKIPMTLKQS